MSRRMTARGFRPSRRRPRLEPLEDRIAPAMIVWGNSSGGDWDTAANWQGGVKPGPADDAVINIAVTNPITHSQNITDAINSLSVTAKAPVNLGNGTLQIAGTLASNGSFTIAGGTLRNATVPAGTTITAVNSSNTLSGVTLDGTLDMGSVFAPKMTVTSGLTLNGTILLGGANGSDVGALTAQGTQTWSGTGSILFGGSDTTDLDHFQRRDADPRRGPDAARPERRDHRDLHQSGDHQRRPGRPAGRQHCGRGLDPHRHGLDQSGDVASR